MLLPWLLTGAIIAATAAFVFWPREAELRAPVRPGEEGALIWGDGVFSSPIELQAWLRARGISYKQWARKHPDAVNLLVAEPGTVLAPKPKSAKPKSAKPTSAKPKSAKPKSAKPGAPVSGGSTKPAGTAQPQGAAAKPKDQRPAQPTERRAEPAAQTYARSGGDTKWIVAALLVLLISIGAAVASIASRFEAAFRLTGVGVGLALSAMCIGIGVAAAAFLS